VSHWAADGSYLDQLGDTWDCGQDNERLCNPEGVAIDSAGRLYVADTENHRVQIFDGSGAYLSTLGDTGTCGTGNYQLCYPRAVAVDGAGRLHVADAGNHRIQIYDSGQNYLATLGQAGTCGGATASCAGPAVSRSHRMDGCSSVDTDNNRVQIFSAYPALVYQQTAGHWRVGRGQRPVCGTGRRGIWQRRHAVRGRCGGTSASRCSCQRRIRPDHRRELGVPYLDR